MRVIDGGGDGYVRERDLPFLIDIDRPMMRDYTPGGTQIIITRLRNASRRLHSASLAGRAYSVQYHVRVVHALTAEIARLCHTLTRKERGRNMKLLSNEGGRS